MDANRRRRVDDLCEEALKLSSGDRAAYLDRACGADADLRAEVESLLAHESAAGRFLQSDVAAMAATLMGTPHDVIGRRFGDYEITAKLGEGGMGEVYRARDRKLGRDVAIKLLSPAFATDRDRMHRFEREARLLATVNHPCIGAIYGVIEIDGLPALVLELVDGETLSVALSRGPLALPRALTLSAQVAEALDHAHRRGIVHRDLKPSNIMLTRDGVKLLDFGVGKWTPAVNDATNTRPSTLTDEGTIIGTTHYMSPEQLEGGSADARSDIFSFGAVLYEMLAGRKAFDGPSQASIVAAILEAPRPRLSDAGVSLPRVERVVAKCLAKDPDERWQSSRDLADELKWIANELGHPVAAAARVRQRRLLVPVGAGIIAALIALAIWNPFRRPPGALPVHFRAELGAAIDIPFQPRFHAATALSPDGTLLAFVGNSGGKTELYVRPLARSDAVPIAGTDGAQSPFFSPDGQWVAFFADAKLKKVRASGGPTVTLTDDAPDPRGGTWSERGLLAFMAGGSGGNQLRVVPETGGEATTLISLAPGEVTQRWPQFLAGGRAVLFTSGSKIGGYNDADLVVQDLQTGARKVVHRGGYYGRYLESGHLLFVHDRTLMAAPFDLGRLEITGPIVPVLTSLRAAVATGGAEFSTSRNGTLVYLRQDGPSTRASWVDRSGRVMPIERDTSNWAQPRISPDGRRVAVGIRSNGQSDIWVADLDRSTMGRLTSDRSSNRPVWTPDGQRIVYASHRDPTTGQNLYWQRADGVGEAQRLTRSPNDQSPVSFHPNGRFLTFAESRQSSAILVLHIDGDEASGWKPATPIVFLDGPEHEMSPVFSPDGHWLAYQSSASGTEELHVTPYPGPGGSRVVSSGGGTGPRWSAKRPELVYAAGDRLNVISFKLQHDALLFESPKPWPNAPLPRNLTNASFFDVHPDGDRVLINGPAASTTNGSSLMADFVLNFHEELRALLTSGRQ